MSHCIGTSGNSLKTQVWIAVALYRLVAIIKRQLRLPHSLYTTLQILSLTLFEKIRISSLMEQLPAVPGVCEGPRVRVLLIPEEDIDRHLRRGSSRNVAVGLHIYAIPVTVEYDLE
jgi:hypothetical protein